MTRTRAADDFVTIRARREELRRVTRPRAADDFPAIRARMEELRQHRAGVLADDDPRRVDSSRPYAIGNRLGPAAGPGLSPAMRRALLKVRTG